MELSLQMFLKKDSALMKQLKKVIINNCCFLKTQYTISIRFLKKPNKNKKGL